MLVAAEVINTKFGLFKTANHQLFSYSKNKMAPSLLITTS